MTSQGTDSDIHKYHKENCDYTIFSNDRLSCDCGLAEALDSERRKAAIEELNHLWSDNPFIYWSENGLSSEYDKSITLSERLTTLSQEDNTNKPSTFEDGFPY